MSGDSSVAFTCNVCGARCTARHDQIGRELPSCRSCGSTVRMRSVVHALSMALFGRCLPIREFPRSPQIRGIGTSDWSGYADRLAQRLDYRNTFYHQEPRLDLCDGAGWPSGELDFVTSTDVFEHVAPPVERAFATVRRLLKPDGVFVFSVPYSLEPDTVEDFPELFEWRVERPAGKPPLLVNRTRDGREQRFGELVFHGGEGATLEMRVFSLDGIRRLARQAGFAEPRVQHASHLACGTIQEVDWSLVMVLRPA